MDKLSIEQQEMLNMLLVLMNFKTRLQGKLQPHDTGHIHTAISVVEDEMDELKQTLGMMNVTAGY